MMVLAAIDWQAFFFVMFALFACVFAIGVLFSGNIVRMAFYLTLSLGATSGLFFLAGAEFVGAMQLMIYVGGTLVLLIFGVMLTAQARFISLKTSAGEWILAVVLGSGLLLLLVHSALSVQSWRTPPALSLGTAVGQLQESSASLARLGGVAGKLLASEGAGLTPEAVDRMEAIHSQAAERTANASAELSSLSPPSEGPLGAAATQLAAVESALEGLRAAVGPSKGSDDEPEVEGEGANAEGDDEPVELDLAAISSDLEKLEQASSNASNALSRASATLVAETETTAQIGLAFAGPRVDKLEQQDEVLKGGMSGYLLPFVIVSVHLLVVLVGAAYMARTKRRALAVES